MAESLRNLLSAEAAMRLEAFSAAANKTTGAQHPADRQRWIAFLIEVHSEGAPLDAMSLRRWLIGEGWPERHADDLISQYNLARDLLDDYDARRTRVSHA